MCFCHQYNTSYLFCLRCMIKIISISNNSFHFLKNNENDNIFLMKVSFIKNTNPFMLKQFSFRKIMTFFKVFYLQF